MYVYTIHRTDPMSGDKKATSRGYGTKYFCQAQASQWFSGYLDDVGGVYLDDLSKANGPGIYGHIILDSDGHVTGYRAVHYEGRGWGIYEKFYGKQLTELVSIDFKPMP